MIENRKLLRHGGSGRTNTDQGRKEEIVAEHLSRFWKLAPRADPDKIIRPITVMEESVIFEECFKPDNGDTEDDSADFYYEFDRLDSFLIQ